MKSYKKYTPFIISLTFHSLLLIFLFITGAGGGDGEGGQGKDEQGQHKGNANNEDIVPKQVEVTLVEAPTKLEKGDIPELPKPTPQKPLDGLTECADDNWFGGIGIYQDAFTGTVSNVIPGYPAYKAGIIPGDVIQPGTPEIRGPEGTTVKITIYRPSTMEMKELTLIRDRICTQRKGEAP